MKRIFAVSLTFILFFAAFSLTAFAEETEPQTTNIPRDPGMCGEAIRTVRGVGYRLEHTV